MVIRGASAEFFCDPVEVAKALHETYCEYARRANLPRSLTWDALDELEKSSRVAAARHVVSERIAPLDDWMSEDDGPVVDEAEDGEDESGEEDSED